jgi:hypothetical protein
MVAVASWFVQGAGLPDHGQQLPEIRILMDARGAAALTHSSIPPRIGFIQVMATLSLVRQSNRNNNTNPRADRAWDGEGMS